MVPNQPVAWEFEGASPNSFGKWSDATIRRPDPPTPQPHPPIRHSEVLRGQPCGAALHERRTGAGAGDRPEPRHLAAGGPGSQKTCEALTISLDFEP